LLKRSKTERAKRAFGHDLVGRDGRDRLLVVDDLPEAARLLGRILRQAGYEVAELTDPDAVVGTLLDEQRPIGAVVASLTTAGTPGGLKLLDALRSHTDGRISGLLVLLISDHPRQQIFSFQAGADAILMRPYRASDLTAELAAMLARPESDRARFRAVEIDRLKATISHPLDPRNESAHFAAGN
jgi:DNA-binding response OmpR family regulator